MVLLAVVAALAAIGVGAAASWAFDDLAVRQARHLGEIVAGRSDIARTLRESFRYVPAPDVAGLVFEVGADARQGGAGRYGGLAGNEEAIALSRDLAGALVQDGTVYLSPLRPEPGIGPLRLWSWVARRVPGTRWAYLLRTSFVAEDLRELLQSEGGRAELEDPSGQLLVASGPGVALERVHRAPVDLRLDGGLHVVPERPGGVWRMGQVSIREAWSSWIFLGAAFSFVVVLFLGIRAVQAVRAVTVRSDALIQLGWLRTVMTAVGFGHNIRAVEEVYAKPIRQFLPGGAEGQAALHRLDYIRDLLALLRLPHEASRRGGAARTDLAGAVSDLLIVTDSEREGRCVRWVAGSPFSGVPVDAFPVPAGPRQWNRIALVGVLGNLARNAWKEQEQFNRTKTIDGFVWRSEKEETAWIHIGFANPAGDGGQSLADRLLDPDPPVRTKADRAHWGLWAIRETVAWFNENDPTCDDMRLWVEQDHFHKRVCVGISLRQVAEGNA